MLSKPIDALSATPSDAQRAEAAMELGRWDVAEAHLRQIVAAEPENAWAMAALALSRTHQYDLIEAAEIIQAAQAISPEDSFVQHVRAAIGSTDAPADALAYAREAV